MTTTNEMARRGHLTLSSHFKLVIYSVHREEVYRHALAFVNTVEPTARGGLATAYRNKAGGKLDTLEDVIQAALNNDLMVNCRVSAATEKSSSSPPEARGEWPDVAKTT